MLCGFEIESEVVGLPCLDERVIVSGVVVVDAGGPVLSEIGNDAVIFWDDVLARDELDAAVCWASVAVGGDVWKLYERMAPVAALEHESAELLEPGLVEIVLRILVLIALSIDELEGPGHDEADSLLYATGEMRVDLDIAIDVIEPLSRGRVDIDSHLPGLPPVGDVLACEGVGGALQGEECRACSCVSLGEIDVAVGCAQDVGAPCKVSEKSFYVHYQLCLRGF